MDCLSKNNTQDTILMVKCEKKLGAGKDGIFWPHVKKLTIITNSVLIIY